MYEYNGLESGGRYFDEWRSEGKPFRPQINLDLTDVSRDLGIVFTLPDPPTTITGDRAVLPANGTIQTNQWKKVSLWLKNVMAYLETYVFKVPSHQSSTNSGSDRLAQTVTVSTWALGLCSTSQAIETSFKRWVEIAWYNWDSYAFWTLLSDQLLKLI